MKSTKPPRLRSLDVLRGATVASMILVNNPGSWDHIYWPLEHAEWNGCTPTDLIMPMFLFIVGVSIVYAMGDRKQDPANHPMLVLRATKRAVVLVLLGWSLAVFPTTHAAVGELIHSPLRWIAGMRIMGVLQRIAIVYFACALLFIKTSWRIWLFVCIAILIGYWAAMTLLPVPDSANHFLRPNLLPDTNLGAWLDRTLLTPAHLYKHGNWDPEGLFSTLSAIGSGLIGMLVGDYLKRGSGSPSEKAARIAVVAAGITLVGWVWSLYFPLNKQLWTGSFTLYTDGIAAMGLALGYWWIDIRGHRRFLTVFTAFGLNAITAFWGSGLVVRLLLLWRASLNGAQIGIKDYLYRTLIEPHFASAKFASFIGALVFAAIWSVIVWGMYRRKIFIKV